MRYGFTTGSCAAAASKAAAYMLLFGKRKEHISIDTPKGIPYHAELLDIERQENYVSCAVRKDGGDDPDITTGSLVYARVERTPVSGEIFIDGGKGVGRVTRRGLDQPVGNAAINSVPRRMIEKELRELCRIADYQDGLKVLISVPAGEGLAKKTFNPRLGIEGGISILGTTGIVEPMSVKALLDTIETEIRQKSVLHYPVLAMSPGNYGLAFMREQYHYELDKSVKCSNFIGESLDMAVKYGFTSCLFTGHLGKLVKVAGGIMNTHSREADSRMELLAALSIPSGLKLSELERILHCTNTEEALEILHRSGKLPEIMQRIAERACCYMNRRTQGKLRVECILYSNDYGELGKSSGAMEMLERLKEFKA